MKAPAPADRLVDLAEELRRRCIRIGLVMIALSTAAFPWTETILRWFQGITAAPLAAFGIADAFLALVTLALGVGAVGVLPYAAWEVLAGLAGAFPGFTRRTRWRVSGATSGLLLRTLDTV